MASLRLENIEKRYENGFHAVKPTTLDIPDGEFVVLLGPSGCGKSTTLRMIAGLEDITAGNLFFGEQRMNDKAPKERDVGMVFQNYALYPHLTVFGNIAFPLQIRKEAKSTIADRVRDVAGLLGLEDLLDRKPKQLSGGQRQRVALGRAIVRQPAVFLFDEPLSNLDARLRVQMRAEILNLQRTLSSTAVYVTHDQTEAMTMGDRIVIMREGEIQQEGSPEDVYNNPANRFVAGFLGSPGMNFFTGRLAGPELVFVEDNDGISLRIPGSAFETAPPQAPQQVTLGIRPEHIVPLSADKAAEADFEATVSLVEYLGHETLLHLSSGGTGKICRIPGGRQSFESGQKHGWRYERSKVYLFDNAGRRL